MRLYRLGTPSIEDLNASNQYFSNPSTQTLQRLENDFRINLSCLFLLTLELCQIRNLHLWTTGILIVLFDPLWILSLAALHPRDVKNPDIIPDPHLVDVPKKDR